MEPGAVLCFFTDGVTDGRSGDEYYGDARLTQLLAEHASQDAAAIAEKVVEDVVAFQNGVARDDIAVVVLQRPAQA